MVYQAPLLAESEGKRLELFRHRSRFFWLPFSERDVYVDWIIVIPLWPFLLGIAVPTVLSLRSRRRYPPGHCVRCGYNLTGNTSGLCPECGTSIETSSCTEPGG